MKGLWSVWERREEHTQEGEGFLEESGPELLLKDKCHLLSWCPN